VADKVEFVPTPAGPVEKASGLAGWNVSISSKSKNKDAAWAFIVYMTSREKAYDYVTRGGTPVRTSILTNEELIAKDRSLPVQLRTLQNANILVQQGISWVPPHEDLGKIMEIAGYYGNSALIGEMSVQDACEAAQKELEANL